MTELEAQQQKKNPLKVVPILLAFLCMGFGDAVGPFVGLAKETFNLSYTMAQLIPFVGFLMFGLLSVPMGIFQDKKGKKIVLLLGLAIALIGLIIPIFGLADNFKISQETITELKKENIPNEVFLKLEDVKDKEYETHKQQFDEWTEMLGKEYVVDFKTRFSKYTEIFQITDKTLDKLKQNDIPGDVMTALEELQKTQIAGKDNFAETVKEKIGEEDFNKYETHIFDHVNRIITYNETSYKVLKNTNLDEQTLIRLQEITGHYSSKDEMMKDLTVAIGEDKAMLCGKTIIRYANQSSYALFLLTILLLGAGSTILQVAGNPIMRDVSPEGKYSRNLSLGQFIKAIGSLSGPMLPIAANIWFGLDWRILFPVYSAFLLLTIVIIGIMKIEEKKYDKSSPATFISCFSLLSNRYVLMMVMAIFFYVGAEVSISSGVPIYLEDQFGIDIEEMGLAGTGLFFLALMIGRFLGAVVLEWISAKKFFIFTSILSIIGLLGLFVGNATVGFVSAFVIGLGFANIFPLVFSITVDHMPERSNELSGLMVTAIVGGAIVPVIMGFVADKTSVVIGFVVPILCLAYILYTSLMSLKKA